MSMPFQYYGSRMHMSADLKRTIAKVRAAKPSMFTPHDVRESSMDGDGRVTVIERRDVKARAPSGSQRHAFCMQRERH